MTESRVEGPVVTISFGLILVVPCGRQDGDDGITSLGHPFGFQTPEKPPLDVSFVRGLLGLTDGPGLRGASRQVANEEHRSGLHILQNLHHLFSSDHARHLRDRIRGAGPDLRLLEGLTKNYGATCRSTTRVRIGGMDKWHHTGVKVRDSFKSAKFSSAWDSFFELIRGGSCLSLGTTATGNFTLLRVRVGGERHELKIETYLLKESIHRGNYHILNRILFTFFTTKISFNDIKVFLCPSEPIWTFNVGEAFFEPVCEEARKRGITFIDDVMKFVFSHPIGVKQDAHQLQRAMDDFKKAVVIALERGASFSDMENILKEKAVSSVMES